MVTGLALLALVGLAACGSDRSDELVRLEIQGSLDFRMDESDGLEHIVNLDEETTIEPDGDGTRTSSAFEGERSFQASGEEIDQLEAALTELDLDELQARFAAEEGDTSTTTLTYEGRTAVLGDRLSEVNYGEGQAQADRFSDVEELISRLSARALPDEIREANREGRRETEEVLQQLDRKSRPRSSCKEAREIAHLNRNRLTPDLRHDIYSQVRPSDRPCP